MVQLHKSYDIAYALELWYKVIMKGRILRDEARPMSSAIVCSTLYADAFNKATRYSLGEVGGVCVPAWLSGAQEFVDVSVNWLSIA